jgi:ribonucleoside-diphosphate reductase alpha chain
VNEQIKQEKTNLIKFQRLLSKGTHPFDSVKWVRKDAVIIGGDGKEKFRQNQVEVPDWWSETTVQVVAEKYFRIVSGVKEDSAKQMFVRVAYWLTQKGIEQGIFEGKPFEQDGCVGFDGPAGTFYLESLFMFVHGMHAFNSPVWFNVGTKEKPQCSACFIQSVDDTMDSITDLAKREIMLFKGGSGTGSNLSALRSSYESLSGGGKASGPVSFMKLLDSGAGVTKSGGTTRRAAKMVVLNIDHPDILEQSNGEEGFISCKAKAEQIAHDLYSTGKYTAEWNKPGNVYDLVGYQNANNSVRVTDEFMDAVVGDGRWSTKRISDKTPVHDYKARELWDKIAEAAWLCGDPGIQFDTTTNDWHTCPNSGRINASNPCSEYLFLDNTACNLSSLNLLAFAEGKKFHVEKFIQACEIATTAKEIIVGASSYPSELIEKNSHAYRTLGLGFTNLGALLTYWGLPYDSNEGRVVAGAISALMTGTAYRMSAQLASICGPFSEYEKNKEPMLNVIRKHWDAAKRLPSLVTKEWQNIVEASYFVWGDAYELGKKHGFRNAQVTVIAPTGTISFLMGADTTGIEPMLGCVVFKKVVGEGLLVLPNRVIRPALENLGYDQTHINSILAHIQKKNTIHGAPGLDSKHERIFSEALGDYALPPDAHVDMMAAVQPFISGGISKTVNMPENSTPQQIAEIYSRAWRQGLKCVAIYRDKCKKSQPISTDVTDNSKNQSKLKWGDRRKMEKTRPSITHKFSIGSQEGYLTVGLYPDGTLGEIFIETSKQGSALMGFVDAWATAVSIGIQHGVPFDVLMEKFQDMRFDPSGFTGEDNIQMAKSIPDYIFRWLEQNVVNHKNLYSTE